MYACLAKTTVLDMHEDEDAHIHHIRHIHQHHHLDKKRLLMYRHIYTVNRWLYIHHVCDERDFSLYFFTLTDVCDLSQHYFASLLMKHKPMVEGNRVYISMLGYKYIRLGPCMHQIETEFWSGEHVEAAYRMLNIIVKNIILDQSREDALTTVAEIQSRFSVMVGEKDILMLREKHKLILDNMDYIRKNCNCGGSSPHENCAILKYFS